MRWKAYLKAGGREDAVDVRPYPVRVSDIDIFDHMNNSVYWSVVEEYLGRSPELLAAPLRVTIEHDLPVALGDEFEILRHVYPAGIDRQVRPGTRRTAAVTTLTYVVGDEDEGRRQSSSRSESIASNSTSVLTCAIVLPHGNF